MRSPSIADLLVTGLAASLAACGTQVYPVAEHPADDPPCTSSPPTQLPLKCPSGTHQEGASRADFSAACHRRDGTRHGPWMSFHPNGLLLDSGCYLDGKEHGRWNVYDESGDLEVSMQYDRGQWHGLIVSIWHPDRHGWRAVVRLDAPDIAANAYFTDKRGELRLPWLEEGQYSATIQLGAHQAVRHFAIRRGRLTRVSVVFDHRDENY
jgi:hypothetical protein